MTTSKSHKYAPWRRAILVPFWTLQILFMLIIIALLALATTVLVKGYDKNADYGLGSSDSAVDDAVDTVTKVVAPIWISLSAICLILTITEIILLTRRKLTPLKFLIFNVIKSTIWTALFVLDIIAWVSVNGRSETALGVIIELVLVLSFWIPLIYSSIIYHRFRKEKKSYKPVSHPLSTPSGAVDTSYPSQYRGFTNTQPQHGHHDVEAQHTHGGATPAYHQGGNYGDVGLAHDSPKIMSPGGGPGTPSIYVQHHDVYEMDNARRNL